MPNPAAVAGPVSPYKARASSGAGEPTIPFGGGAEPSCYSVSQISEILRLKIERDFRSVRVRGEISGLKIASSGHAYFSLKDDGAVMDAVCWRQTALACRQWLEEGGEVIASGKMTVYAGRSKYQLVAESVEPAGRGALAAKLERLKAKLQAEGLFDPAAKRPLPFLPECVAVITSPTGAVIRDILHRLRERFPCRVLLFPTQVQGEGSEEGVLAAFDMIRSLTAAAAEGRASRGGLPAPDVVIVARGGGSLEDLMTFNMERVVRAVAACPVPVISGVGHETDVTLCDHAADLRAPTPTAAAEAAVPVRAELIRRTDELEIRLPGALTRSVAFKRQALLQSGGRASAALGAAFASRAARLRSLELRLVSAGAAFIRRRRRRLEAVPGAGEPLRRGFLARVRRLAAVSARANMSLPAALAAKRRRLTAVRPAASAAAALIARGRLRLMTAYAPAAPAMRSRLKVAAAKLAGLARAAAAVSHRAVLARGYAMVRQQGSVVGDLAALKRGEPLSLEFRDGVSDPLVLSPLND